LISPCAANAVKKKSAAVTCRLSGCNFMLPI